MPPLDPLPVALQHWQNFYMLTGGAAATLTGLMFVAVTFGSGLVTKETARSARAFLDPIYVHFAQVLLTSCLLTVPVLTPLVLGAILVGAGALRVVGLVWIYGRYREAHEKNGDVELSDWLGAIVLPGVAHVALVAIGAALVRGDTSVLVWLAVVSLTLLVLALYGAWELLVWMALEVNERGNTRGERP